MATCGDLFGGDLYEEEQAVELAKYIEALKSGADLEESNEDEDEVEAKPITPYVEQVSVLVRATCRTLHSKLHSLGSLSTKCTRRI